jgi:hypothetical protein
MIEYVELLIVIFIISVGLIAGSHWCFNDAFNKPIETKLGDNKDD